MVGGKKRGREAAEEDSDLEDIDDLLGAISGYAKSSRPKSVNSGVSLKSTKPTGSTKPIGSEYRAKRAMGDVKLKAQKYDPYAYIPMNRMALNRRLVKCINNYITVFAVAECIKTILQSFRKHCNKVELIYYE